MTRLFDPSFEYTCSSGTNIRERFKREGFTPPEHAAHEAEKEARIDGALRCMRYLQSLPPKATVTPITKVRKS